MTKTVAIIYYNRYCYSSILAEHIGKGVEKQGANAVTYDIAHAGNSMISLNEADAIIFGSPTYFGSVAAEVKGFMDATVDIWNNKQWNNKVAAGFTHSSALSGDKLATLMTMFVFAAQHGMIWAGLDLRSCEKVKDYGLELNQPGSWIGLMAQSPKDGEKKPSDLETAEYFGTRIAKVTQKVGYYE
ncbi:flavodoxin family protein [Candidatus Bandiella euplotis]|uniref:NADPH-dependent FMN reductase n=1 Tax=Candidatus Bandiella euplotis TaxID=1664265 RepID=A0ABZ0UNR6_9RICK|nr:flavodoxin family protein [Candidatus Bandiella woodruffii]WPX96343.1 NADPH-dependent FMN reductase [Candidatus Bandiella woodruffii]